MKNTIVLKNWSIKKRDSSDNFGANSKYKNVLLSGDGWIDSKESYQVQEILIANGCISDALVEDGDAEYCKWVSEYDWVYHCRFESPESGDNVVLCFNGLDTVADIYLNEEHLGTSVTMYLPYRFDISEKLKRQNDLLVYFHRHQKMISHYEKTMPEAWIGNVPARAMLRKSHDYGARNGYSPIGLFDEVYLEIVDKTILGITDIDITFDIDRTLADVAILMQGPACTGFIETEFLLEEEDGSNPVIVREPAEIGCDSWKVQMLLKVPDPKLWWPKNYGPHPLYHAAFRVYVDGNIVDERVKTIGFRDVRVIGSMKFEVNGVVVRFWGANIAPIWGMTNRFNREVTLDLIDKADKCNINALRVWGPNKPYPDDLYNECDKRGIMVWQDFPTGGSEMPDSPEYTRLFLDEAEHMVRRLKHHPSIILWCGGNENIYMCELLGKKTRIGFEMLTHGYRGVCLALDPQRYYHISCPADGRYTNDPAFGDTHGSRALRSYCAGEQYGIFFSENIRVYPPQFRSFQRFMKEEIWEDGYVDTKPFGCAFPMPAGWRKRIGNHGERKFGPIGDYYSATNAKELVYKYTAAAGQDIYDMIARSRKGNPAHKSHEERLCTGHMMWKLNDPWPNFYCAFIDYYGECGIPYYAAKRAFSPFMIHFEISDHIYLWGINDTSEDIDGTLEVKLYDIEELEAVKKEFSIPATVTAGESKILTNLDRLGFFFWESVLYACFKDRQGNVLSTTYGYVAKENMLPFHKAVLSLTYQDGCMHVTTDKFARCVELSGNVDGDEFGWFFEDNYFDLLPFETKAVRIYGEHTRGSISAKAHYSDQTTTIDI